MYRNIRSEQIIVNAITSPPPTSLVNGNNIQQQILTAYVFQSMTDDWKKLIWPFILLSTLFLSLNSIALAQAHEEPKNSLSFASALSPELSYDSVLPKTTSMLNTSNRVTALNLPRDDREISLISVPEPNESFSDGGISASIASGLGYGFIGMVVADLIPAMVVFAYRQGKKAVNSAVSKE